MKQGSRVIIAVVQVWAVKIQEAAVEEALRKKMKNRMKLRLPPPKLRGKLVSVSVIISFSKIFIPCYLRI